MPACTLAYINYHLTFRSFCLYVVRYVFAYLRVRDDVFGECGCAAACRDICVYTVVGHANTPNAQSDIWKSNFQRILTRDLIGIETAIAGRQLGGPLHKTNDIVSVSALCP